MTSDTPFSRALRQLRKERGEAQAVVAEAIGISRPHLTNLERGRDNPSLETAMALADYFGVGLDFLQGIQPMKSVVLSELEQLLIEGFRHLSDDEAKVIVKLILSGTRPPQQ